MAAPSPLAPLAALLSGDAAALRAAPAAAAALVLVALALALLLARALLPGRRRDAVLLVGPCGAGKTALFSLLRDGGVFGGSVTSMAENVARVALRGGGGGGSGASRAVTLVDLPGHPRLRGRLDAYAPSARALVFLVDGRDGAFLPACRETAELLLDVLSHPALARRTPPLLLAVNKTDRGAGCHSVQFVRKRLEKEIDALRQARGTLADAGGSSAAAAASDGGVLSRVSAATPFTFDAARLRLTTAGISVLANDVDAVRAFAVAA